MNMKKLLPLFLLLLTRVSFAQEIDPKIGVWDLPVFSEEGKERSLHLEIEKNEETSVWIVKVSATVKTLSDLSSEESCSVMTEAIVEGNTITPKEDQYFTNEKNCHVSLSKLNYLIMDVVDADHAELAQAYSRDVKMKITRVQPQQKLD